MKARAKAPVMLAAAFEELREYVAGPKSGEGGELWTMLGDADLVVVPEVPDFDRRVRDVTAAGWGTRSKTLTYGLARTGLSRAEVMAGCVERIRDGRLVLRDGRWQSWAAKGQVRL